jgi:CPA1 family monovalent cation:H+ antiporter
LLVVTVGSVVLGFVLSRVLMRILLRVQDVSTAVVIQFCCTFGVWTLAERLHLSGILTLVVFAMTAARRASEFTPARLRVPAYAVWDFAVFVLNVLAFILIGFQLKGILARITPFTLLEYIGIGAAVCTATIIARILWVSTAAWLGRRRYRAGHDGGPRQPFALSRGAAAIVGWCGLRGIVTLAAALALPAQFPYRDLVLFTAFSVVLGTLVVQGMTLRPLIQKLGLEGDPTVAREVRFARVETTRAALAALDDAPEDEMSVALRRRYEVLLRRAEAELASDGVAAREPGEAGMTDIDIDLIRTATSAERRKLLSLRADGTISDAAFQQIEQDLDLEELDLFPTQANA